MLLLNLRLPALSETVSGAECQSSCNSDRNQSRYETATSRVSVSCLFMELITYSAVVCTGTRLREIKEFDGTERRAVSGGGVRRFFPSATLLPFMAKEREKRRGWKKFARLYKLNRFIMAL